MKKLVLRMVINAYCNLNCPDCAHHAYMFDSSYNYDLNMFKEDMTNISKIQDKLRWLELTGGEPTINPNLEEYINIVKNTMPKIPLEIRTNGTRLFDMDENVYNNINIITITKHKLAKKDENYYKEAEKYIKSINKDITINYAFNGFYSNHADAEVYDLEYPEEDPCKNNVYESNGCFNGYIYKCMRSTFIGEYVLNHDNLKNKTLFGRQLTDIDFFKEDGFKITKDISYIKLLQYLHNKKPLNTCYLCNDSIRDIWGGGQHPI